MQGFGQAEIGSGDDEGEIARRWWERCLPRKVDPFSAESVGVDGPGTRANHGQSRRKRRLNQGVAWIAHV